MSDSLLNYKGLYGDTISPLRPDFIHIETLESRSKLYDWEIHEHLHTELIQLFLFRSGSGFVTSGNEKITLNPPCLVFIPVNTLHGFHFHSGTDGDVITLSENYFDNTMKNAEAITLKLDRLLHFPLKQVKETLSDLEFIRQKLEKELQEPFPEKIILESLFRLLFSSIYRLRSNEENNILISNNRTLGYFQSYNKLIRKNLTTHLPVTYFANELGITTVHLNRICQSVAKKTALQIIHEHLISEAKNYLLNTNYSISEVAYFLHFQDPAHFSKLFKKNVGVPPGEFRNS